MSQKVVKFLLFGVLWNLVVGLVIGDASNDYEIRSLSGEPNYRSVNLTWEIEEKPTKENEKQNFIIYFCEIQSWGPNRCKSKNYNENTQSKIKPNKEKHYSLLIDNLRMATKYSFHVRKHAKAGEQRISARDFDENDLETNGINESIIIPTKGFSAHATKCLSHASEIEVETGPYFGGKIASEKGDCGIKGDPEDPKEVYIMKIDHEKCGSKVNNENLTVETFITVQENLGIFTHSTRRFMVLCTYHPEMLTVRASFSVPGKGGAVPMTQSWPANERNARERNFQLVDKSSLILKENDPDRELYDSGVDSLNEIQSKTTEELEHIVKERTGKTIDDNLIDKYERNSKHIHFARLVDDRTNYDENLNSSFSNDQNSTATSAILITISLSVIMCGAFIYVIQREILKQKKNQNQHNIINP